MKKLFKFITLGLLVVSLTGCNQDLGLGALHFKGIHVQLNEATECHHYEIKSWCDSEMGIEIKTSDYGSFFLSEGSYAMFTSDFCPICGKVVDLE